jgi:hypothetical protein
MTSSGLAYRAARGPAKRVEALCPRPADFLLRVYVAPVAHLGATDLNRPDPGLDRAMRPMAMTHDAVAAIRQFQFFHMATKAPAPELQKSRSGRRF